MLCSIQIALIILSAVSSFVSITHFKTLHFANSIPNAHSTHFQAQDNRLLTVYKKWDYVVILWSSKNALRGRIDAKRVEALSRTCSKTNLISPMHYNRPILNRIIHEQNLIISKTLSDVNSNAYFVPLLFETSNGFLKYSDRSSIAQHICARLRRKCDTEVIVNGNSTSSNTENMRDPSAAESQSESNLVAVKPN